MGSGGSKKNSDSRLNPNKNQERRLSHVDTNPPPISNVLVKVNVSYNNVHAWSACIYDDYSLIWLVLIFLITFSVKFAAGHLPPIAFPNMKR